MLLPPQGHGLEEGSGTAPSAPVRERRHLGRTALTPPVHDAAARGFQRGAEDHQRRLLAWGDATRRDLPWRRTRDPWAVLVSEVMLQQTQVARVVPRYHGFLRRFPTPAACASASVADVIAEWRGLGYNRRAVNLHRAAATVVAEHGGSLPDELDGLLALPGVGPYTARAILAFAFERDVGVLDTNVGRVLARLQGRSLRPAEAQRLADDLVPHDQAWAWNQTMLDLGATICTAATPDCGRCPASERCAWRADGRPVPDPATGSAAVAGPQSAFQGSDRQGRGRLVDALRAGVVARSEVPTACGWPDASQRASRVADSLVADGLAVWDGDTLRLPGRAGPAGPPPEAASGRRSHPETAPAP